MYKKDDLSIDKGINVLSLFDGISCGHVALDRAGIKVKNIMPAKLTLTQLKLHNKTILIQYNLEI